MAGSYHRLGKVQFQIMQVLWRRKRATAREITDDLHQPTRPITHSTVQTLLRELEAKGTITHDIEERTFVFRPLYEQEEVTQLATRDFLSHLFDGSPFGLVAHLLKHEKLSPEELERLRNLIDDDASRDEKKA